MARGGLASGTGVRVLIIEDNKDSADSLRMLLEFMGHDALVAYSGPQGIELASSRAPAAVLSDIGLPGMDGFEVARRLRKNPALTGLKLIAITAYSGAELEDRARAAGFD